MTSFDSKRGRVWAVLLGLMGGMIIGLPFRPAPRFDGRWQPHCHHGRWAAEAGAGCPWMKRHALQDQADRAFVIIPPSATVRELHVAPGVGVRLELESGRPARDPFSAPRPKAP